MLTFVAIDCSVFEHNCVITFIYVFVNNISSRLFQMATTTEDIIMVDMDMCTATAMDTDTGTDMVMVMVRIIQFIILSSIWSIVFNNRFRWIFHQQADIIMAKLIVFYNEQMNFNESQINWIKLKIINVHYNTYLSTSVVYLKLNRS